MKTFFKKAQYYIILMGCLVLFSCSSILHKNDISTIESNNHKKQGVDSMSIINEPKAIINGDHREYMLFHNAYVNAVMNGDVTNQMRHDGLLYSYIMAEMYHDTLAALDFIRFLEDSGSPINSNTSLIVVRFLEMASKSKPDPLSFLATKKLYEIYLNGRFGIEEDSRKAKYYEKLCDSIARVMNH